MFEKKVTKLWLAGMYESDEDGAFYFQIGSIVEQYSVYYILFM